MCNVMKQLNKLSWPTHWQSHYLHTVPVEPAGVAGRTLEDGVAEDGLDEVQTDGARLRQTEVWTRTHRLSGAVIRTVRPGHRHSREMWAYWQLYSSQTFAVLNPPQEFVVYIFHTSISISHLVLLLLSLNIFDDTSCFQVCKKLNLTKSDYRFGSAQTKVQHYNSLYHRASEKNKQRMHDMWNQRSWQS